MTVILWLLCWIGKVNWLGCAQPDEEKCLRAGSLCPPPSQARLSDCAQAVRGLYVHFSSNNIFLMETGK